MSLKQPELYLKLQPARNSCVIKTRKCHFLEFLPQPMETVGQKSRRKIFLNKAQIGGPAAVRLTLPA